VTSTEAPDKRPDPTTAEGQDVIRAYLDAVHALFAEAIARGRGTTVADVNENFGRGAVFVAADAKKRGMIDKSPPALRAVGTKTQATAEAEPEPQPAAPAASATKVRTMDIQTLKSQHPDVYAAILADGKKAGVEEGTTAGTAAERKRVTAHLKMAETTGANDVAFKAIREGASVLDEDVHADYMSAAMNRRDQSARQTESDDAAAALEGGAGAGSAEPNSDIGDQVVAVLDARSGKKGGA